MNRGHRDCSLMLTVGVVLSSSAVTAIAIRVATVPSD